LEKGIAVSNGRTWTRGFKKMRVYLEEKLMDYKNHISCFEDLITSYNETRAGFIFIALEKNRIAAPFINEARALRLANIDFYFLLNGINQWISSKTMTDDLEAENAKGLSWEYPARGARTLYFNITVSTIKNNIDIILLNKACTKNSKEIIENSENYIALGELKGGIDPAGADEHWKTAKTALDRIKNSFAQHSFYPAIFFISAAIEHKMASEIYTNLETGYINNAANLTKPDHITSLVAWLLEQ
jgi:type II restriction enzyme